MSGDVQPRKRKDKKRRKDETEDTTPVQVQRTPPSAPISTDETIHVHKDSGTGGGICAKLVFFALFAALISVIGFAIVEYRGLTDLDTVDVDSKFSQIFAGWVDTSPGDEHDHDEVQYSHEDESGEEHDSEEPLSEEEEEEEDEVEDEPEPHSEEDEDEEDEIEEPEDETAEMSDEAEADGEEDDNEPDMDETDENEEEVNQDEDEEDEDGSREVTQDDDDEAGEDAKEGGAETAKGVSDDEVDELYSEDEKEKKKSGEQSAYLFENITNGDDWIIRDDLDAAGAHLENE